MDHETLVTLNKEKDKEIKTLQKKLDKLEERYVQKHKENEGLHKHTEMF